MKKLIIVTVFITCLALCAAVWPQTGTAEETPTYPQASAVSTPEPTAADANSEAEIIPPAEKEVEIPQDEPLYESIPESGPVQEEMPIIAEVQPTPAPASAPTPVTTPTSSQTATDPQPGDMVYVPSFGWLECQGPGEVIHDESIYENGNKIGIMG